MNARLDEKCLSVSLNQWAQGSSPWRCTRPHPVCCMRTGFFVCLFGCLRPARAPSSPLAKCLDIENAADGISFHLFHPPLTDTASASGLPIPKEFKADPKKVGYGLAKHFLVQEVCDLPLASAGSADGLFLPASLVHRAADDPNGHARPEPLTSPYPIIWTSRAHKGRVKMDSRVDATTAPAPSCSS